MTGKERLVVSLSGGGPWGFRLQGGAGTGLPLIVSKVRRKSKAHRRLREGDCILSVNGRSCEGLTYDQLMDIADKSGTDLTLEIHRKECDKENQAPQYQQQQPAVKMSHEMDKAPIVQEIVSSTETSTKVTEEKEGIRIKSATVMSEPRAFESFTSSKLEERPVEVKATEPFPSFKDLQMESRPDMSTSSKQESVTGDDQNFTKKIVETKHEVKGGTETSFIKKQEESFSKSTSADAHGLPDITMDTIDLNNLISETQKRLDSFRNNFKGDGMVDTSIGEIKKSEIISSSKTSETKAFEVSNLISENVTQKMQTSNLMSENTTQNICSESTGLGQNSESVVSNQTDPVKKIPPPTLPKPKTRPTPSLDVFKDCLKEMKMDPAFSLPDLGFTSQSSESSTITTDIPFGTATTAVMKKKMFSSSSFYEEPQSIYPTLEEQVEMARKIASSLADDTNKKSKGSNMFYKRVKRSSKWIHEGPEPSDESGPGTPEIQGIEPPTPDPSQVPFKPSMGPHRLKLILDPRHTLDLTALRSSGNVISEHNVVSPEVCHGLVKDLHSPVGKGAALFAKRKKKSEEWVVDEEKVKSLLREQEHRRFTAPPLSTSPAMQQYSSLGRQEVKLVKSPWEAAMESPYGLCDSAFSRVNPDHLADTVIRAADNKKGGSLSRESSRMEGCISPPVPPPLTPAAAHYDIYHAKAPTGWAGSHVTSDYLPPVAPAPLPLDHSAVPQQTSTVQNGFQQPRKMVFQNFNAVPRLWKGASVH